MKSLILSVFLSISSCCMAQTMQQGIIFSSPIAASGAFGAQDIWTHFTTGSGNITTTNLATGTAGTSNCAWSRHGTAASLTVGTSQTTLPYSVGPIAATTYPAGTTTQTIAIDDGDNSSAPYFTCTLGSAPSIATVSGYFTLNMTSSPLSSYLFDRVVVSGSGVTSYAAIQAEVGEICLARGGYGIDIETAPGGVTTHTPCIPLAPGGKYWVTMQANKTTGIASLSIYNPVNFALVGSLATTSANYGASGTIFSYLVGQDETGLSTGTTSYIEDLMVDFTNHVYPVIPVTPPAAPRYVEQGTSNSSVASGTTLTAVRTPGSTANGFIVEACTSATTGAITITDSQGNSYTQNTAPVNLTSERCATSSKFGLASTAADTVTATFGTSSTFRAMHVIECANCTAIDQNTGFASHTSTAGGAVSTSSVTPSQQPELAIAFFSGPNGNYTAPGWAPLAMDPLTVAVISGAQINSTSSVTANAVDATAASGVATNTQLITIQ